ncbi:hypothetical protein sce4654 [Sorangium cellulosum So ce56]|uniref:Uncharacterized protein n=1 Tax=Sorangium cellulosum (strain So ce56) TaxID=448385 RepID=A9F9Y8_SORC5|nr:hypothetical protein [Sorangium cellulosum]CAN94817.1 hypothetical protein sce4654 [Sorangium cellulosum So ce56]
MWKLFRTPWFKLVCAAVLGIGCDHGYLGDDIQAEVASSDSRYGSVDNVDNVDGDRGVGSGNKMTFRKVALSLSDEKSTAGIYDLAVGGNVVWASAYTFNKTTRDKGPMVVWEKVGSKDFALATLPPTHAVHFPDVCAVSAEEAYVLALDGPDRKARLFARKSGDKPLFEEQPAVEPSEGRYFSVMRLACFPGGNLWVYGSMQKGDDIGNKVHALFHRPSTHEAWHAVPLPHDLPPPSWSSGVSLLLLRADGSGYAGFSLGGEARIYERTQDGIWEKVFAIGDEALQIASAVGDPSGRAVAIAQPKGNEGIILSLEDAVWSTKIVPEASEFRATAQTPEGELLIGGVRYSRSGGVVDAAEAVLVNSDLQRFPVPVRGRVHAMGFLSETGYVAINFTEKVEDAGLYEVRF